MGAVTGPGFAPGINRPAAQPRPGAGMDLALLLLSDPASFRAAFKLRVLQNQHLKLKLRSQSSRVARKKATLQARAVQEYIFD